MDAFWYNSSDTMNVLREVFLIFIDKPYYSIGELSAICDIPQKTLRYYDEIGLFTPDKRNQETHYRLYSKGQIITVVIIKNLKQMGFSLKEIKEIVSENEAKALEKNMLKKLQSMKQEIEESINRYTEYCYFLKKIQNGIDILEELSEGHSSEMKISVEYIQEINLLHDRRVMKDYDYSEISLERWLGIMDKAKTMNCKIAGPVYVTFYDNNILNKFLSQDSEIEFAVQVEESRPADHIRPFGGITAATVIHVGNYEDISSTYIQLIKWIKKHHYKTAGPATEEFILSPLDVNDETRRVTKIIIPVEKED